MVKEHTKNQHNKMVVPLKQNNWSVCSAMLFPALENMGTNVGARLYIAIKRQKQDFSEERKKTPANCHVQKNRGDHGSGNPITDISGKGVGMFGMFPAPFGGDNTA